MIKKILQLFNKTTPAASKRIVVKLPKETMFYHDRQQYNMFKTEFLFEGNLKDSYWDSFSKFEHILTESFHTNTVQSLKEYDKEICIALIKHFVDSIPLM